MTSQLQTDSQAVVAHVVATIGKPPYPAFVGWPGDIETAIVDAVFSIRYNYDLLVPRLKSWVVTGRGPRPSGPNLVDLRADITASGGPGGWAKINFTGHFTGGRPKADAIDDAAGALVWRGIKTAADVTQDCVHEFMETLQSIRGIDFATSRYAAMLLGFQEVKPDIQVRRFIKAALDREVHKDAEVVVLLKTAAEALGAPDVRALDHAVWKYQRTQ